MKVLIACEFSGITREAFTKKGHDATSCDLLPTEKPGKHYEGDVLELLDEEWDMMIAHPPCTYLCSSGTHWNARRPERAAKTEKAIRFVKALWAADIPRIAIENPIGVLSTRMCRPTQYIQPYEFGHDASKRTGLWLKNLPELKPTKMVEPRTVNGKRRWGNQTDSGQNKLGPSADRWALRSLTYQGWADAMADQWSNLPTI